jgi:aminopeptidase
MIWGLKKARRLKYKKNDVITLNYNISAVTLAENIYHKLIGEGFNVVARSFTTENMEFSFYSQANKRQLSFIAPWEKVYCESVTGSIHLFAPEQLTHLKDIDPKKMSIAAVARKPLRRIMEKKEAEGNYGWTLCTFPTQEPADKAKLTLKQYTNQIIRACYLDVKDPIGKWEEIYQESLAIKKWLNAMKVDYFHIESKNTDLKIYPGEKRKWIGISGHNIPSFELFLSPDFRKTEGVFYANMPSFKSGNYVVGVKVQFETWNIMTRNAYPFSFFSWIYF